MPFTRPAGADGWKQKKEIWVGCVSSLSTGYATTRTGAPLHPWLHPAAPPGLDAENGFIDELNIHALS